MTRKRRQRKDLRHGGAAATTPPCPRRRSDRAGPRHVGFVSLVLVALVAICYGNTLANPFVTDDKVVIVGDPRVQQGDVPALLTEEYWPGSAGNGLYRPLVSLSFALNAAICNQPWCYRLVNLALYAATAVVLLLFARDLAGSLRIAALSAVLFVLHPIHTEPLNAIVERTDLAAGFFGLASVWLYWRRSRSSPDSGATSERGIEPGPRRRGAIFAWLLMAAAILSKESALTWLAVVPVLDLAAPRLRSMPTGWLRRRARTTYLPLLLMLFAYFGVRIAVLGELTRSAERVSVVDNVLVDPTYGLADDVSPWLPRAATPVAVFGLSVWLLTWPWPLLWDYSYATIPPVASLLDLRFVWGLVALVGVIAAAAWSYRRVPVVFAGLGILLLTYAITSNAVVIAGTLFAERFLYLPSIGLCLCLGWLAARSLETLTTNRRRLPRLAAASFLLVLAIGAALALPANLIRSRAWRSDARLNATDLQNNPHSARLWASVAADALNTGDGPRARAHALRAAEICSDYPVAWRLAGLASWRLNRFDEADDYLARSLALAGPHDMSAVLAAADIHRRRGDYAAAIALLRAHLDVAQPRPAVLNNLAWYLITAEPPTLRDAEKALTHARAACAAEPAAGDILDTYVRVLLALDRRSEAIRVLGTALPDIPDNDPFKRDLRGQLEVLRRSADHP